MLSEVEALDLANAHRPAMKPPSLGVRVLARFLDGILISVVVAAVLGTADRGDAARPGALVVDVAGGLVTWRQAAIRSVTLLVPVALLAPRIDTIGEWAVLVIVVANFVVARRCEDRRGLHDLAARTQPVAPA